MHQNNKPLQVISELGKHVKIAETEREKCTEWRDIWNVVVIALNAIQRHVSPPLKTLGYLFIH